MGCFTSKVKPYNGSKHKEDEPIPPREALVDEWYDRSLTKRWKAGEREAAFRAENPHRRHKIRRRQRRIPIEKLEAARDKRDGGVDLVEVSQKWSQNIPKSFWQMENSHEPRRNTRSPPAWVYDSA